MTIPNLAGEIKASDVHSKGTGKFAADYVAWAKTAEILHRKAPGWDYHLLGAADGGLVHKAPDGTGYVIGYFTGPDNQRTSDFPYACMDNRNMAIPVEKIGARVLTDTHRRSLCAAAAFHFSLAYELWAREEIEGMEESASAKTTPAQAKPANVKQAVASQAFQAGQKAIKAAKTLESLSDLSKRVAERFDKKDLSKQEYDDLLKLLLNKESELKEFEK
jgi:hypothetical protein